MCYTRRKIEGGVGALRESDDTNFLKPNGQSRNLNIYGYIILFDLYSAYIGQYAWPTLSIYGIVKLSSSLLALLLMWEL